MKRINLYLVLWFAIKAVGIQAASENPVTLRPVVKKLSKTALKALHKFQETHENPLIKADAGLFLKYYNNPVAKKTAIVVKKKNFFGPHISTTPGQITPQTATQEDFEHKYSSETINGINTLGIQNYNEILPLEQGISESTNQTTNRFRLIAGLSIFTSMLLPILTYFKLPTNTNPMLKIAAPIMSYLISLGSLTPILLNRFHKPLKKRESSLRKAYAKNYQRVCPLNLTPINYLDSSKPDNNLLFVGLTDELRKHLNTKKIFVRKGKQKSMPYHSRK